MINVNIHVVDYGLWIDVSEPLLSLLHDQSLEFVLCF